MSLLIKNGRVIDPATGKNGSYDVLVEDGLVSKVEVGITDDADEVIDATGCVVSPGLIDLHVHFREPGYEHKETIKTGALAAAKGGFTTVCPMPNTIPAVDSTEMLDDLKERIKANAAVNVLPVAAITMGQAGEYLVDIKGMAEHGAIAISEDGKSVMNTALYKKAMQQAAVAGIPVMAHCEDKNLVGKGVLNEGPKSKELGMMGISNSVEDVIVARDILLAKETGATLHLCHCSTKDSVELIRIAKEHGIKVTGEVCPHHFTLCDEDIKEDDSNYKMNPPLRSREDVNALKEGLKSGVMDVISTDHAPHHASEKQASIKTAPFGIVGLETSLALTITELVEKGYLTLEQMIEKMSVNPAKVIGIDRGTLGVGKVADITIFDPEEAYVIDSKDFVSMGKNTPFNGMKVKGVVKYTIVDGKVVYKKGE